MLGVLTAPPLTAASWAAFSLGSKVWPLPLMLYFDC